MTTEGTGGRGRRARSSGQKSPDVASDQLRAEARKTLVGRFFHVFDDPEEGGSGPRWINRQGVVVDDLGEGYYLVDHFEWISGGSDFYGKVVVHVSRMAEAGWSFYETAEAMREAYESGGRKRPVYRTPSDEEE
jgi:hypothetical protein